MENRVTDTLIMVACHGWLFPVQVPDDTHFFRRQYFSVTPGSAHVLKFTDGRISTGVTSEAKTEQKV